MKHLLTATLASLALVAAAPTGADTPESLQWKFKVFLDDKEIGYHDFAVTEQGPTRKVESEASFDVKFLFFNAYSYRHNNAEVWNQDCLDDLSSTTDANGKAFSVSGETASGAFRVENGASVRELPQCVMSFAYWNPAILSADRLLNSQTGEYQKVDIVRAGLDQIDVNGTAVPADRYELRLEKGAITVWYSVGDQRWLSLDAPAKGKRRIRYLPESVPQTLVDRANPEIGSGIPNAAVTQP